MRNFAKKLMEKYRFVIAGLLLVVSSCTTENLHFATNGKMDSTRSVKGKPFVDITIYAGENLLLGDPYDIGIEIGGFVSDEHPAIQLMQDGSFDGNYLTIDQFSGNDIDGYYCTLNAAKPGKVLLRVEMTEVLTGEKHYSEWRDMTTLFPSTSDILGELSIVSDFGALWNATVNSEMSGNRCEYGCAISMTVGTDIHKTFSTSFYQGESTKECDVTNTISFDLIDDVQSSSNGGGTYTIGVYHTHPPLSTCPRNYSRETGMSSIDESEAKRLKIPSFVDDYTPWESTLEGGHNPFGAHEYKNISNIDRREK